MTVELDTSGLVAGDTAGLGLLSTPYAWIGVVKTAEGTTLQMVHRRRRRDAAAARPLRAVPTPAIGPATPPAHLWLRVHCNFDTDQAIFSWSADGKQFTPLGNPFTTTFQLTTFQGVRPALFNFNTSGQPGGYADFDNYTVEEPRARGIEREIPMGKTITLTSGADGSFLAADTQNNVLVNAAPDSAGAIPQNARFQVIDLGQGPRRAEGRQRPVRFGGPGAGDPEGPGQGQARRCGILPVGQPDARRHDAHVADQSSLPGHQAQRPWPGDRHRSWRHRRAQERCGIQVEGGCPLATLG